MSDYVRQHGRIKTFQTPSANWVVVGDELDGLRRKIKDSGTRVAELEVQINYGIKTGCNEAFIIDTPTKDFLCQKDPRSVEIIRPILRGKDIKKWVPKWDGYWIIATAPFLDLDITKYQGVKHYLKEIGVRKLEQSGKEGARKKTNHEWWELQDSIAYWNSFFEKKIIWGNLSTTPRFAFCDQNMLLSAPSNLLTSSKVNLHFLLGILNSLPLYLQVKDSAYSREGGYLEYKKQFIENAIIPNVDKRQEALIEYYVKSLIELTSKKEHQEILRFENLIEEECISAYKLTGDDRALLIKALSPFSISNK